LTDRRARRVGLELGGFLVVAAAVVAYRRGPTPLAVIAGVLGAFLLVLVATRSVLIVPIAGRWMRVGSALSRVTTPVFLTVLYLLVFTPMAWMRRMLGRSPIVRAPASATYWVRREARPAEELRESMERQF
jgi:uncharacterized membrane protein